MRLLATGLAKIWSSFEAENKTKSVSYSQSIEAISDWLGLADATASRLITDGVSGLMDGQVTTRKVAPARPWIS